MSIQKKSLLNSLNTTKKAIVASSTPANEDPKVSAKVSARAVPRVMVHHKAPVMGGRIAGHVTTRVKK